MTERWRITPRHCRTCGAEYLPTSANQRYCAAHKTGVKTAAEYIREAATRRGAAPSAARAWSTVQDRATRIPLTRLRGADDYPEPDKPFVRAKTLAEAETMEHS